MSAWKSGVIDPSNVGKQTDPGGLATFGTTLYYIGNGESGDAIYVNRADLTTPRNLSQSGSWSSELLSAQQIAFTNNVQPQTKRRTGLASMPASSHNVARLYLFWSDSNHSDQCYATWTEAPNFSGASQWVQNARLYTSNSYTDRLVVKSGGVNAVPWGDQIFLVYLSDDAESLHIALFDPADIAPQSSEVFWAPRWSTTISGTRFQAINSGIDLDNGNLARDVSATWISYGAEANRLIVALYNGDEHEAGLYALPFGSNGHVSNPTYYSVQHNVYQGAFIQRDPAGRIRLYYADTNHTPQVVTVSTKDDGQLSRNNPVVLNGTSSATVQNAMPVTFYLAPADGSQLLSYEVAVYGKDADSAASTINAQIAEYGYVGKSYSEADYYLYQTQVPWTVSGIMDPFPLASSDVTQISNGRAVMATVYGVTEARTTTHTVSETTALGVTTSGNITLGVGVAWETALSAGPTQTNTQSSRLAQTKTREGYSGTASSGGASADIAYFVAGLGMAFETATFKDMDQNLVQDGLQMVTAYPTVQVEHDYSTPAYAITAGDLTSWTADAINARMNHLFPVSSDYRKKYPFTNYVQDVIEANAVPLGSNNQKCLMVSLGPASMTRDAYEAVQVEVSETGWTFTDEAYGGLAEGLDFEVCGVGFKSAMTAMVGITYSAQDTTQTEQESQWAVAVQAQTAAESLSVNTSYTAKMYLLRSDTRWVEELRAANPSNPTIQKLDPASAPWRIVYVVDLG